mmetsp:Transcript_77622/g.180036  ORF Transcript_77622/g.180036 Transcript_77622/m.180036 type:complete len:481 (-) Transcript_77622:83-1525(-)
MVDRRWWSSLSLCARLRTVCRRGLSRNALRLSALISTALIAALLVSTSGCLQQNAWKRATRANRLPHSDWEFAGWKVKVGDQITMDDTIAVLRDRLSGREKAIRASKDGTVLELQGYWHEGDIIQEHMISGHELAIVGKFIEPSLGFMEAAVVVPNTNLVFEYFLVKEGDWVNAGDDVAQVAQLRAHTGTERKLQAEFIKVQAPKAGHISWMLPLRPGRISEQSSSPVIAKVILPVPWWPPMLVALLTSCCCLVSLQQVMTDPKIAYETVPPASARTCSTLPLTKSELGPQEQVSEISSMSTSPLGGVRLDFESEGRISSVFAKYRPLGTQHSSEAPCVVCGFTVNSYAEAELGVQKGWKLVRIGGEQLDDGSIAVRDKLDECMDDLPTWPLLLEFKQSGGGSKVCSFSEGPIGLELAQTEPTKVARVHKGGKALSAGIREGWTLTKIGSCEVSENQGYWELSTTLEEAVKALDISGYRV